jgi:hypothetical protein
VDSLFSEINALEAEWAEHRPEAVLNRKLAADEFDLGWTDVLPSISNFVDFLILVCCYFVAFV